MKTIRKTYGMFSKEGNAKVRQLVDGLGKAAHIGILNTPELILNATVKGMDAVEDAGYPEVWDTVVRDYIWAEVLKICEENSIPTDLWK